MRLRDITPLSELSECPSYNRINNFNMHSIIYGNTPLEL